MLMMPKFYGKNAISGAEELSPVTSKGINASFGVINESTTHKQQV